MSNRSAAVSVTSSARLPIRQEPQTSPPTSTRQAPRVASGRRDDTRLGRSRPEHPLVVAAEEVNVIRCFGTFDRRKVFAQRHRRISLDLHIREAIVEFPHPPVDARSACTESLAEPVVQAIDRCRSIRAEVADDGPMSRFIEVRDAAPSWVRIQRGEGDLASRDGPSARSPCHAKGLRNVKESSTNAEPRWANRGLTVTAAESSARVSGPSATASRTAARRSGQSSGASR